MDREFSYLELLLHLVAAKVHFVIRLNLGSHPPKFLRSDDQEVELSISRGKKVIYRGVWYQGQVQVNLIGIWKKGNAEPLWVMTDLDPEEGLRIYLKRMKIDNFRDLKNLLGLERQMNKRWERSKGAACCALLVYAIGLLVGESLRDYLYGEQITPGERVPEKERIPGKPHLKQGFVRLNLKDGNGNAIPACSCCSNRSGRFPHISGGPSLERL